MDKLAPVIDINLYYAKKHDQREPGAGEVFYSFDEDTGGVTPLDDLSATIIEEQIRYYEEHSEWPWSAPDWALQRAEFFDVCDDDPIVLKGVLLGLVEYHKAK